MHMALQVNRHVSMSGSCALEPIHSLSIIDRTCFFTLLIVQNHL